jgi:SAM-dependent methyltransferase
MSRGFYRDLIADASAPYRGAGRFAWHFARGKLALDPVFPALLSLALIPDRARILDLGCGQGLLLALLTAARNRFESREWSADWPPPPRVDSYRGIEIMARDVDRARRAWGVLGSFHQGDIRMATFGSCNVVVLLDVLHYLDYPAQGDLLGRVSKALEPSGVVLLRVGDAAGGLPFRIGQWVDRAVMTARGHRLSMLHCRPVRDWCGQLESLGFAVEVQPMSEGTPFANVLLIARSGGR